MGVKWKLPEYFDIVWCRFPYGGQPTGARHPCLVVGVGAAEVMVVGGTSAGKNGRWTRGITQTDFVLQDPASLKRAGLTNPTAFQFEAATIATLPFNDTFFVAVPPKNSPVCGCVDLSQDAKALAAFMSAGKTAGLRKLLDDEISRVKALELTKESTPVKGTSPEDSSEQGSFAQPSPSRDASDLPDQYATGD